MQTVAEERRPYLEAFAASAGHRSGNGRAWVDALRKEGIERFEQQGFPTQKEEAWRATSLAPLTRVPFALAEGRSTAGLTPEVLERLTFEPWECSHLVFVNGRFTPSLSRLRRLPAGVKIRSLEAALDEERDRLEPLLRRPATTQAPSFAALNAAFLRDGAFVEVPAGTGLKEPIHLLFVSMAEDRPTVSHPRTVALFGDRSRATLVESYVGIRDDLTFTNAATTVVAGDGAAVDHIRLQRESEEAFHVGNLEVEIGRDGRFASHSIALGGALVRNDIAVRLAAEGADCVLNGLYVTSGRRHVDTHTLIDHAKPHGTSRELYKGVLDDASRGVFDGMIIVRPAAVKSDARQENRNLLLSEDALVDSKPTLLINNDDVKCSHAATIGQLDEDALFYLRSRGLGDETARSLLIHAFVSDIVSRLTVSPVRAGLECLLFTRLPKHHPGRV